jgi:RNA recognition motif-containing protein
MKLYVGNLAFSVTEEALKKAFSEFGEITEATVIVDKFSKRSKGFGFVTFSDDEAARKAISAMNEKELEGRPLKVSEAKPMEESDRPRRSFDRNDNRSRRPSQGGFNRRRY